MSPTLPHWRAFSAAALLLICMFFCLPSQAARLALVIGNDAYRQIEPLNNARNDARLIAATLKDAGFEFDRVHENLDRKDMLRAINAFKARITKADDVVFFYAGHGIQIGRQSPVLLPVDITQENDDQILQDGVQLSTVQSALEGAGFALLVIDACRDNPFPRKSDGTRGLARQTGLELIQQPLVGSMVVMSAGSGEKALDYVPDGTRGNGLFTNEFVQAIRSPGKPLILAISEVKARVTAKAQRMGNSQRPTYLDESTGGGFVFFPTQAPVVSLEASAPSFSNASKTLEALALNSDPTWQVQIEPYVSPQWREEGRLPFNWANTQRLKIGNSDRLQISVQSQKAGYLYLVYASKDSNQFALLYPGEREKFVAPIQANKPLTIPSRWPAVGNNGRPEQNTILALVSEQPMPELHQHLQGNAKPATVELSQKLTKAAPVCKFLGAPEERCARSPRKMLGSGETKEFDSAIGLYGAARVIVEEY
jgi:hypothetical protein